jgi:hypothetical protein
METASRELPHPDPEVLRLTLDAEQDRDPFVQPPEWLSDHRTKKNRAPPICFRLRELRASLKYLLKIWLTRGVCELSGCDLVVCDGRFEVVTR